jgi:uncharacterized protein (TIGR00297 family)
MVAAILTGGLIFGFGGLPWAALLLTFFVSSSALSKAFKRRKAELAEKFSKGSQRDWGQVLANGGLGALLAIGFAFKPHPNWIWLAFAGAMAAVNADTWSTELGVLSPVPPRMITSGKQVERGTSGGISLTGTLAGQVVMEGFLNFRMRPALRRLITRLIAIIPAIIVTAIYGASGTARLLVLSQVILSLQLSFAVIPLVLFTGDRQKMGQFVNPTWLKILAWSVTIVIVCLNAKLLADSIGLTGLIVRLFR